VCFLYFHNEEKESIFNLLNYFILHCRSYEDWLLFLIFSKINIMLLRRFILKMVLENGMIKAGEFFKGWKV